MFGRGLTGLLLVGLGFAIPAMSGELDADGVQSLMKKSGCFKCHAVDKKKDMSARHCECLSR